MLFVDDKQGVIAEFSEVLQGLEDVRRLLLPTALAFFILVFFKLAFERVFSLGFGKFLIELFLIFRMNNIHYSLSMLEGNM